METTEKFRAKVAGKYVGKGYQVITKTTTEGKKMFVKWDN